MELLFIGKILSIDDGKVYASLWNPQTNERFESKMGPNVCLKTSLREDDEFKVELTDAKEICITKLRPQRISPARLKEILDKVDFIFKQYE